jgi:hypothetical protein
MEKESKLEKYSGSLPVNITVSTIAALAGGPVAALLPILTGSLANKRHQNRVIKAIKDIESDLSEVIDKVQELSDAQYKFINETIITILHSPDDEKIKYLKEAIKNSMLSTNLELHDAGVISRVLRDITACELVFLIENHKTKIVFHDNENKEYKKISPFSEAGEKARGLINQGLFAKEGPEGTWDDDATYIATPLSDKIINLII